MKNKAEELLIKLAIVNAEIKESKAKSSVLGQCDYYQLKHIGEVRDAKPINQSCIDTAIFIKNDNNSGHDVYGEFIDFHEAFNNMDFIPCEICKKYIELKVARKPLIKKRGHIKGAITRMGQRLLKNNG